MVKTLTIKTEIPAGRKLEIQLPDDVPTGPAEIALAVFTSQEPTAAPVEPYSWIDSCLEHPLDTDRTDLSENVEDFTGRRF